MKEDCMRRVQGYSILVLLLLFSSITLAGTVTDIDGNVYQTVTIGTQVWMAENLKVTHYRNGDSIPNVTDNNAWRALTTGAYCEYNDDISNVATYGRLYNWYAVSDSRNIAPTGWHVPTDDEWKQLEMTLGMSQAQADSIGWRGTTEGGKLKEVGTTHWLTPNTGATNESGFSALPGGYRYFYRGNYSDMGNSDYFWSSTQYSAYAWYRTLYYNRSGLLRDLNYREDGFSVRCVNDIPLGIDEHGGAEHPDAFKLIQNYPNPFNPSTSIEYSVPTRTHVTVEIFNLLGQHVRTLVDGMKSPGTYKIDWDGTDGAGRSVSTGVYMYRLKAGDCSGTKKMMLLK
jgi:uncharacterized protein (TIGR02145 family)